MDYKLVILGLCGLAGLYFLATFFFTPFRYLLRLFAWALLGTVLLVAVNLVGGLVGLHIAVNIFTILTAGILNVPGVVLLVLLRLFVV
ncbi:MAG: pro-sigmaK processing inhibitor BofA family protein [Desulfotomaculales bacterium]